MQIRYQTLPLSGSMDKRNKIEKQKKNETSCFRTNIPPLETIWYITQMIHVVWYIYLHLP